MRIRGSHGDRCHIKTKTNVRTFFQPQRRQERGITERWQTKKKKKKKEGVGRRNSDGRLAGPECIVLLSRFSQTPLCRANLPTNPAYLATYRLFLLTLRPFSPVYSPTFSLTRAPCLHLFRTRGKHGERAASHGGEDGAVVWRGCCSPTICTLRCA